MSTVEDGFEHRRQLTFEQAEGAHPLPTPLALKQVSQELRALVWAVFHNSIMPFNREWSIAIVDDPWLGILNDKWVRKDHRYADEFNPSYKLNLASLKAEFGGADYLQFFGLLQWFLRHSQTPWAFREATANALVEARAAYKIIDGTTIVPIASPQEGEAIERAFADTKASELGGARRHLQDAADAATRGDWAASINGSIDAVEAVAKVRSGANTLSDALKILTPQLGLHKAIVNSLSRFYDFTSDEKGLRHSLTEADKARVDQSDALLALGVCAAYVSYFANKAPTGDRQK